jgi:hypothetical protein
MQLLRRGWPVHSKKRSHYAGGPKKRKALLAAVEFFRKNLNHDGILTRGWKRQGSTRLGGGSKKRTHYGGPLKKTKPLFPPARLFSDEPGRPIANVLTATRLVLLPRGRWPLEKTNPLWWPGTENKQVPSR